MTEAVSSPHEFSRFRRYLWPIHGHELKKLIPMLLMAFFIGFAYNILRGMKDSLLVTAAGSGAEVIPFVKVWAMLPLAVLLTVVFIKLSHRYSTETVFYLVLSGFLGYFMIFAFVLYPLQDYFHPHRLMDYLQARLPEGFMGLIAMVRYWTFSLYYGMAELWGNMILTVLFWGFANEVTKVGEAKRFYGVLGIGANLSSVAAGQVSCILSSRLYNPNWPIGVDRWHQTLILLTLSVFLAGCAVITIFRWFNVRVIRAGGEAANRTNLSLEKLQSKSSMKDNFSYLAKSKYLFSLAVIVICYNMVINLVEVLWKHQVRQLFPDPNDYNHYQGQVTTVTGIIAVTLALLVSGNVIRKFGWTVTAMLTPAILLLTSIGFLGCYLLPDHHLTMLTGILGTTPLALIVFFGSAQNCFSRACKYSVFDATKELSYIPLSREMRIRGKAAIDGVGSRMGKSGGSLVYQGLLMIFRNIPQSAPVVSAILIGVLSTWCLAVKSLGKQLQKLTLEQASALSPQPQSSGSEFTLQQETARS
jgi:ATP:ADP antiporter, AAA family